MKKVKDILYGRGKAVEYADFADVKVPGRIVLKTIFNFSRIKGKRV